MNIKYNQAFRTDNYEKFKRLDGNRGVQLMRVKKVMDSVKANGYIYSPLIVNERYEVVDGQARLEAFKQLGIPVDYIMEKGLTVKDCVALNLYQTKWNLYDFINSFAELGNTSYQYLQNLIKRFPMFPVDTITAACGYASRAANTVKAGEFECGPGTYSVAQQVLDWLKELRPYMDRAKGNTGYISYALIFAWKQPDIDANRLRDKFIRYYSTSVVKPYVDVGGAVKAVAEVYNYKTAFERINLDLRYEEDMRKRQSMSGKLKKRYSDGKD